MYHVHWYGYDGAQTMREQLTGDGAMFQSLDGAKALGNVKVALSGGYFLVLQGVRGKRWRVAFDSRAGY
jgi:hypothetical protein